MNNDTFHYTVAIPADGSIHVGIGTNLTDAETNERSERFWAAFRRTLVTSEKNARLDGFKDGYQIGYSDAAADDAGRSDSAPDLSDEKIQQRFEAFYG